MKRTSVMASICSVAALLACSVETTRASDIAQTFAGIRTDRNTTVCSNTSDCNIIFLATANDWRLTTVTCNLSFSAANVTMNVLELGVFVSNTFKAKGPNLDITYPIGYTSNSTRYNFVSQISYGVQGLLAPVIHINYAPATSLTANCTVSGPYN